MAETRSEARDDLTIQDPRVSDRVQKFPESVIREMTRIAALHDAVNLAQGFPDFDPPRAMVDAAKRALDAGYNQYSITWGARELRDAIARRAKAFNGIDADPDANLVVTCGSTEAMMAAMLSLINPGDEAVIFEPFYENYGPDAIVSGASPRYVRMAWPDWSIDEEALKAAFTDRTKAVILNTPNNPTGKVFTREELRLVADLCEDHDVVAVTDEIYEHIVFDGARHVSLATLGDMADRTITINGLSKTYSATGWRVGWAIAPKTLANAMRRTHDFLTVGAPHPLQIAAAAALDLPESYYRELARMYQAKRDGFVRGLQEAGLDCRPPRGAYYVMTDFSRFPFPDDWSFAMHLVERCGVAVVPGSSFYGDPGDGRRYVRFMFSKKDDTLAEAVRRLRGLRDGR
ncbi:MAG TPA: aminotransferase class I/II-fold pyridoxal phosphate-dependent enzyme [Thermoplasmata archaeon]|jgi:aminotransferase|nr:aminotransferase class I/II-fold pyridoxal phosphate-dependent enzyme [Thermoplasmata archaeon]